MKQFDSRNIDKRAERLLRYHAGLLMEKGIPMVKENENYYIYDQNKEDYMKMGYSKTKKLLSRTFNLEIKSVIHDLDFSEDFRLKMQFKGFPNITDAYFKSQKGNRRYEAFFQDPSFMESIVKEAKKVELAYIYIQYHKASRKMEIRVCPYAGAFLWVIFPPVFYDMRLKEEELSSVYKIAEMMKHYVVHNLCSS